MARCFSKKFNLIQLFRKKASKTGYNKHENLIELNKNLINNNFKNNFNYYKQSVTYFVDEGDDDCQLLNSNNYIDLDETDNNFNKHHNVSIVEITDDYELSKHTNLINFTSKESSNENNIFESNEIKPKELSLEKNENAFEANNDVIKIEMQKCKNNKREINSLGCEETSDEDVSKTIENKEKRLKKLAHAETVLEQFAIESQTRENRTNIDENKLTNADEIVPEKITIRKCMDTSAEIRKRMSLKISENMESINTTKEEKVYQKLVHKLKAHQMIVKTREPVKISLKTFLSGDEDNAKTKFDNKLRSNRINPVSAFSARVVLINTLSF